MAAGDAYIIGPTSTGDTAFLDVQPGAGVEVVIHNVYAPLGSAVELYRYDGTNSILYDSSAADGTRYNMQFHCTNATRLRIKNVSGGTIFLAADGMVTK